MELTLAALSLGVPAGLIIFGIAVWLALSVMSGGLLDERIELARTQNEDIEQKVMLVVEKYMNHESDTYKSLKPDEAILAASIYPELQSNTLVQEQIKVYENNNKKITSLKEEAIGLKIKRWWLYFGN